MIKVCVRRDGITVTGHARHGPPGQDIVCAAMSTLTQNLIRSMADYGMDVVDSGVAVLNMHAPYEVSSKSDIYQAVKGYKAFLKWGCEDEKRG